MGLLVDHVVLVLAKARDALVDLPILVARRLTLAADDERRAGFVDEDRVHFVDDGVIQAALRVVERTELHVVAQVIKAKLVILAVGNIRAIGDLLFVLTLGMDDRAHRQAEKAIELPHPLGVTPREIVVHGDDVHALPFEGVQVTGKRRDECLALAGAHLGDASPVKDHASDELHVVMAHPKHAFAGLATDGERLVEDVVESGAAIDFFLELDRLGLELGVGQLRDARFERVDSLDMRSYPPDLAIVGGTEDFLERPSEHGESRTFPPRRVEAN